MAGGKGEETLTFLLLRHLLNESVTRPDTKVSLDQRCRHTQGGRSGRREDGDCQGAKSKLLEVMVSLGKAGRRGQP